MAGGNPAAAERHLRLAVAVDPLRESAQRALLQALAAGGNYAAALLTFSRQRFDVLLVDIMMPGMDGYEFMRTVRALPPEKGGRVPAATLTARAVTDDRLESLLAGFQNHLAKPVEPAELVEVVATLAGR